MKKKAQPTCKEFLLKKNFSTQEHLYNSNTPNAATLEAIKQIERDKNLVESDNLDDLFKKLGI